MPKKIKEAVAKVKAKVKGEASKVAEIETTPRPYDLSDQRDNAVEPEEKSQDEGADEEEE